MEPTRLASNPDLWPTDSGTYRYQQVHPELKTTHMCVCRKCPVRRCWMAGVMLDGTWIVSEAKTSNDAIKMSFGKIKEGLAWK
jgi:hypothetical protein|tara:strand:- start:261 stop:509 length:249 start_codon:yes stop_codon:yes gene_type:complete